MVVVPSSVWLPMSVVPGTIVAPVDVANAYGPPPAHAVDVAVTTGGVLVRVAVLVTAGVDEGVTQAAPPLDREVFSLMNVQQLGPNNPPVLQILPLP